MQLTLSPTSQMVEINGVPGRVWEGTTSDGIPVQVLITQVAVPKDQDNSAFERELREVDAPEPTALVFPLRMIL